MQPERGRRSKLRDQTAPLSPEILALRLRRGDSGAVEEVRKRVGRILEYGRVAIPAQDRDDLEQEIMTDVWQAVNQPRFDFSGGFWGFVEVVAARRCIDWLRARRQRAVQPRDDFVEFATGKPGPLRETLDRERRELAREIVLGLKTTCQELIYFRLRDGLSYQEIAQVTGKSEGSLRVQLYRCIRQARKAWRLKLKARVGRRRREEGDPE